MIRVQFPNPYSVKGASATRNCPQLCCKLKWVRSGKKCVMCGFWWYLVLYPAQPPPPQFEFVWRSYAQPAKCGMFQQDLVDRQGWHKIINLGQLLKSWRGGGGEIAAQRSSKINQTDKFCKWSSLLPHFMSSCEGCFLYTHVLNRHSHCQKNLTFLWEWCPKNWINA